ncbi:MAG: 50S ribosomal protein L9 [Candidatus Dasytiphilus stammeri]
MKIILLDTVSNLGKSGEQVSVKAGYARNFLFPRRLALPATPQNIEFFYTQQQQLETQKLELLNNALKRSDEINSVGEFKICAKTGPEGKLFGSIGTREIMNSIIMTGILINRNEIKLPEDSLRTSGKHEVLLEFHPHVKTKIVVNIIPEITASTP